MTFGMKQPTKRRDGLYCSPVDGIYKIILIHQELHDEEPAAVAALLRICCKNCGLAGSFNAIRATCDRTASCFFASVTRRITPALRIDVIRLSRCSGVMVKFARYLFQMDTVRFIVIFVTIYVRSYTLSSKYVTIIWKFVTLSRVF